MTSSRRSQKLQASLGHAERRQRNLFRAIEEAPDPDEAVLGRVRELAEEQKRLSLELASLEKARRNGGPGLSRPEVERLLQDVPRILDAADHDQIRDLLCTFVRRVVVTPVPRPSKGRLRLIPKEVTVEFYPLFAASRGPPGSGEERAGTQTLPVGVGPEDELTSKTTAAGGQKGGEA